MISIGFFPKSLKDLKGIFFISFRNPKKLKMLDRPSDRCGQGLQAALRRKSQNSIRSKFIRGKKVV
jgi:hypothetical protein